MEDITAIRRLKRGDVTGLEKLIARYEHKARQAAFQITHDEQLAADVVQETFLRVYQNIQRVDETRPFAPYLFRCVTNAAINAVKKIRRWVQWEDKPETSLQISRTQEIASVEEQVEQNLLQQRIRTALSALSPRQQMVILQRYYLEMSEKEMAESDCIAKGTVKWLLNTAREKLHRLNVKIE